MRMIGSLALAFVVVAAVGATGQDGEGKKAAKPAGAGIHLTIKNLDTDADGVVSKDEWMAVFNKLNTSGDAGLNEAEINAGSAAYPCSGQAAARKRPEGKGDGK